MLLWEGVLAKIPATGLLLELGVYQGSSINCIAAIVQPRLVIGFDSFFGLEETFGRYPKGCFSRGGAVPSGLRPNVQLIIGRIQDTIEQFVSEIGDEKIAFVNFDLDLYEPTIFTLNALDGHFKQNAIILFDEYDDAIYGKEHEQRAFAEFLAKSNYRAEFIGKRLWHAYAFRLIQ